MSDEKGNGLAGLVVIKAICCGTLVLAVTGVLGGFGAWLLDDGLVWFILIVAAAAVGWFLWRRKAQGRPLHLPPRIRQLLIR